MTFQEQLLQILTTEQVRREEPMSRHTTFRIGGPVRLMALPKTEEEAKKVLSESEIDIIVTAGDGPGSATAWGCDLTYEYVHINGDYRT